MLRELILRLNTHQQREFLAVVRQQGKIFSVIPKDELITILRKISKH